MKAAYTANGDARRVTCRQCGETRIRAGALAAHLASIGHPRPFDFSSPSYRRLLAAAMAARAVR
jgi:hypothetical protein